MNTVYAYLRGINSNKMDISRRAVSFPHKSLALPVSVIAYSWGRSSNIETKSVFLFHLTQQIIASYLSPYPSVPQ